MIFRDDFNGLKERATKVLQGDSKLNGLEFNRDMYELINELTLYQIELELQNEDLRKAQLELEESRNKYMDLYEFAPAGYFTFDRNGIILDANEAGADLLGVKKSALINRNFTRYIAPDYQYPFYQHRQQVYLNSSAHCCELRLLKRNGPIFYAQIHSKSLNKKASGTMEFLSFVSDITSRKRAEILSQQHQQKVTYIERMNSLTELMTIISGELNQPLTIINNYITGCIRRLESGNFEADAFLKVMKNANKQTERTSKILLRLKNFTCNNSLTYEPTCMKTLVNDVIELLQQEFQDYPVTIKTRIGKYLPLAMVDHVHIEQVLLNIARNAVEAMRDDNVSEPRLIIELNIIDISTLEVCIIDNGPGLHPENAHKLFDPDFTTKSYGTGISLAICRAIIETHGGNIAVESNPIGGALFRFTLKLCE